MTTDQPNGSKASIRELVEVRLNERLDRLEDKLTTRTRWTISTLIAAAAVVVALVAVLVR